MRSTSTFFSYTSAVAVARWMAGAIALAALLAPRTGEACSPASNPTFETDVALRANDTSPPGEVSASVERVEIDDSDTGADCGGLDQIILAVDYPAGDEEVGYELAHVSGERVVADGMRARAQDGRVFLYPLQQRAEGDTFRSVISIRAVDRAGNTGPPLELTIADDGGSGCSMSGHRRSSWAIAAAVLAMAARRTSKCRSR